MVKDEQFLTLSSLAYEPFSDNDINKSLKEIIKKVPKTNRLELKPLSSLVSWHLINATTTSSGMSAIAVQNPVTKDIVFAYRGTDIDKNIWEAMKDIESDIAIASSGNVFCIGWAEPSPRCLHLLYRDDQESWWRCSCGHQELHRSFTRWWTGTVYGV